MRLIIPKKQEHKALASQLLYINIHKCTTIHKQWFVYHKKPIKHSFKPFAVIRAVGGRTKYTITDFSTKKIIFSCRTIREALLLAEKFSQDTYTKRRDE